MPPTILRPPAVGDCTHPEELVVHCHPYKFPEGQDVWYCDKCDLSFISKPGGEFVLATTECEEHGTTVGMGHCPGCRKKKA